MRYFFLLGLLLVQIAPIRAQDSAQDYFVEAVVDNPAPFVGQQIIYSFRLYDAVGLDNPLYEPSDYEGFWRAQIGPATQSVQQVNGKQYIVMACGGTKLGAKGGDSYVAFALP